LNNLRDVIESRRKQLAQIDKPSLDDYKRLCDQQTLDLVASFQRAVVDDLVSKTLTAANAFDVATLLVTGGVAANSELRETFEREGAKAGIAVYFPSRPLSTDNAAMIAAAAYPKFVAGDFASMDISAEAGMVLR
jgi:N6-L-threonylcarbamoyladenine synthase